MHIYFFSLRFGVLGFVLTALLLGCSSPRQVLNLDPKAPDEFTIVKKAPLILPPNFNLRPPKEGVSGPSSIEASEQARRALIGSKAKNTELLASGEALSQGELVFLDRAGAKEAQADIRQVLMAENSQLAAYGKDFVSRLIRRDASKTGAEVLVEPAVEQRRIQEQRATGSVGTKGQELVVIRRKRPSRVPRIF